MSKGLGIAALVIAILAVFVPLVTIWVIWLALALAAFAAFGGDKSFPIAAVLVCLVNLLFMSPLTLMMLKGESLQGGSSYMIITIIAFIVPIVGMVMSKDSSAANAGAENSRVVADQPLVENKTCPQCGRRYSGTVTTCEADGAVLVA